MRFFLLIRNLIIGLVLAAAAVFFGYQTYEVWSENDRPEINKPVGKPPKAVAARKVANRRNPRYNTYAVIAKKNLFSSDRREKLPEKPSPPKPAKPLKSLGIRFALFGIVIKGDEKKALISNFDKKRATEKEYIWVKVGDKIGTMNVSEIKPDQIIITEQGNTYTIRLSDQEHPQKRSVGRKRIKRPGTKTRKNIKKPKVISPATKGTKASS
jgi:hypothetical protein